MSFLVWMSKSEKFLLRQLFLAVQVLPIKRTNVMVEPPSKLWPVLSIYNFGASLNISTLHLVNYSFRGLLTCLIVEIFFTLALKKLTTFRISSAAVCLYVYDTPKA